jgi:hypothetical protein
MSRVVVVRQPRCGDLDRSGISSRCDWTAQLARIGIDPDGSASQRVLTKLKCKAAIDAIGQHGHVLSVRCPKPQSRGPAGCPIQVSSAPAATKYRYKPPSLCTMERYIGHEQFSSISSPLLKSFLSSIFPHGLLPLQTHSEKDKGE